MNRWGRGKERQYLLLIGNSNILCTKDKSLVRVITKFSDDVAPQRSTDEFMGIFLISQFYS
jgi:hypothetical protein